MKITPLRGLLFLGALCASSLGLRAQVIEFSATLSAAQEPNNASTSPATGSAIMLYDIATNTFDLIVSISGMTNTATASHIHEAAAGVNGPVVTNLGGEAEYTRTGGTTVRRTFRNVTHLGDRVKLITGGAYYNIHSAQFPGGEIRGQLIPRPVRLVANLDVAQEQAAFPAVNLAGVTSFGGAVATYNPVTNKISVRHSLFNYTNPFTNSHIHEGAPGVSGPVRVNLGTNSNAGAYSSANGYIAGAHDELDFTGDMMVLLTGGMYLNYHSQTFAGGQLRGQLTVSNDLPGTRLYNVATRGFVGGAGQELIAGFAVTGGEPVRVMITAKGPSLSAFGVTGALGNPRLALHDSAGRQIATNDDIGATAGTEFARTPGAPTNTAEAALIVVLPAGNYTAVVSSASGTGVALVEAYDLRAVSPSANLITQNRLAPTAKSASFAAAPAKSSGRPAVLEICDGLPLAAAVVVVAK